MAEGQAQRKADLLLHPVRLRIMTEIVGKQLTPRQLAAALPDVPQATLYRQINILLESNILEVVEETPVSGAVERTYQLRQGAERPPTEEMRDFSDDDHLRYFNIFMASLIEHFTRYVQQRDSAHFEQDGMSYNRAVIYLTAEERVKFQQDVMALVGGVMANTPSPDRQRYTLASIVIPDERTSS
jgi:DNA-binding transcriptional ArsR family regulator